MSTNLPYWMDELPERWALGQRSRERLATCDRQLQQVVELASRISHLDITVLEGHRTLERQQALYRQGASQCDGLRRRSKHQRSPSIAVDVAPYPVDWQDTRKFYVLAGAMQAAAALLGVRLRGGFDWDGDGDFNDNKFQDLPHFELVM